MGEGYIAGEIAAVDSSQGDAFAKNRRSTDSVNHIGLD
jgi:hypothetical protein